MSSAVQSFPASELPTGFGARVLLITSIVIVLAYLLPESWHYYPDSVAYTGWALHNPWWNMLHPHHLILRPLIYDAWWIADRLGTSIHALELWRWAGVASGLGSLWYMLRCLRRSGFSPGWTALAVVSLASCWYMWIFSTTPTHYSLTLIWMMLIYHDLLTWKTAEDIGDANGRIAMALFLAVMIHQLAILMLVPILGWMWWLCRRDAAPFAPLPMLRQLLVPTIFIYLASAMFATDSVDPLKIWNWLTYYGQNHGYWWWQNVPEGMTPLGYWISLVAGGYSDLLWVYPGSAYERLTGNFPAVLTAIEAAGKGAPVANLWWTAVNPHMIGLTKAMLLIIAFWLPVAIALLWRMGGQVRDHLILALLWSAPLAVFHAGYCVGDGWFRLYYLLPLFWILTAPIVLAPQSPGKISGVVAWVALLVFTISNNIANGYTIWRYPESNPWLADIPLVNALEGPLILTNEHELVAMDSFYILAFGNQVPFDGEILRREAMPADAVLTAEIPWDRLYIEADLLEPLTTFTQDSHVLQLTWAVTGAPEASEWWIPLERLAIDRQPVAGTYALVEARVNP